MYLLYLCASTVQFNSLFGMVTYKPKYIEQQYGQSSSKANLVIGMLTCPSRLLLGTIRYVSLTVRRFRESCFYALTKGDLWHFRYEVKK